LHRVVCAYDADAFAHMLHLHGLHEKYPRLVEYLRGGFPIGDFPALTRSVIHPNHPSVDAHLQFVSEYLEAEVALGRMSGPFSQAEMESVCGGPFQSSPLLVVVRPGGLGEPDKLRPCINLSKRGPDAPAVNDHIDPDDFLTRFDSTSEMADLVSILLHPFHLFHTGSIYG
jgi:hypothetical protein